MFIAGCGIKPAVTSSQPVFVVLKTKKLKFADSGFLKYTNTDTSINLFNAGASVLDMQIKEKLSCINKICLRPQRFDEKFLGQRYYDDFLNDLVHKRPIFKSKNIKQSQDGFSQNIKDRDKDIIYEVNSHTLKFKDKKNFIFIKIKVIN